VRFVIDMNLSTDWVDCLQRAGHDALHWSAVGPADATDDRIIDWARGADRIVVTNDLDFGTLLAMSCAARPSVVELRTDTTLSARIGPLVVQALARAEADLLSGAILTIEADRLRLRALDFARKE
jgi:predicted nuclease of predicted toxin-antitoxin system